jgi:hypothetical protein
MLEVVNMNIECWEMKIRDWNTQCRPSSLAYSVQFWTMYDNNLTKVIFNYQNIYPNKFLVKIESMKLIEDWTIDD